MPIAPFSFAKYEGPEIDHIELTTSVPGEIRQQPDVDTSAATSIFICRYPAGAQVPSRSGEKQITGGGLPTRSDSVRVVESTSDSQPGIFKGKKKSEVKTYLFQEALGFYPKHQDPRTIISAVVHMDEKTPICTFAVP